MELNLKERVENLDRRQVLIGVIIVGLIILLIDFLANGSKFDISMNLSGLQLTGIIMIVTGSLLAGFLSKRCPRPKQSSILE